MPASYVSQDLPVALTEGDVKKPRTGVHQLAGAVFHET